MRLAAFVLACAACDTGVHRFELGPLDANPACEEAKNHSDLPWIQTHIFDRSCASSTACHKESDPMSGSLSLADGDSYWALAQLEKQKGQSKQALEHAQLALQKPIVLQSDELDHEIHKFIDDLSPKKK